MAERFSWVINNVLAGMERPGLFQDLVKDLKFLKKQRIEVIVNLEEFFWDYPGFEVFHLPIVDFDSPSLEGFNEFVNFVDLKIQERKKIVVHCHAGMGRTNLMIASYLIKNSLIDPDIALQMVRKKRPVYWITQDQEESLKQFYYTLSV